MTTNSLRKDYLSFFTSKDHRIVASDSLVPKGDPTLLFTSAGMNQFKDYFLGQKKDIKRATSCQKCLRTGDLERVGKTPYHHTFFEMLGNFSFGDYFKEDTILWAWEFLTKRLNLKEKDLWVSVYQDDHKAYDVWKKRIGVPVDKIARFGPDDNFWPANALVNGPDGPCGPCSEIFFDWGKSKGCGKKDCNPSCGCGRFVEIWNLVFTQFNRIGLNKTEPLPSKNIDTGMGLERMSSVLQGKATNFDIDILKPIVDDAASFVRAEDPNLHFAIADHIRAVVFAISDGIYPSNEDRGYVIRRILRRALWFGFSCGQKKPFLHKLTGIVAKVMQEPYPEVYEKCPVIGDVILAEENRFLSTLDKGKKLLFSFVAEAKTQKDKGISGEEAFKLYDTYGFPYELTKGILEDKGLTVDEKGFNVLLEQQRASSREKSKFSDTVFTKDEFVGCPSHFIGPDAQIEVKGFPAVLKDSIPLREKGRYGLILDQTPFYFISGGQLHDKGFIIGQGRLKFTFEVEEVEKIGESIIHKGVVKEGDLPQGKGLDVKVGALVDLPRRKAIARAHTSTHMLQAALRDILGPHVQQQGSLVDEDHFRFDFTHFKGLSPQELSLVEEKVNAYIVSDSDVCKARLSFKEAKAQGALAFFEEKYESDVRVVEIKDVSKELCGGIHLDRTSQACAFVITSEGSISSGIRRIEAVCGKKAYELLRRNKKIINEASAVIKVDALQLASAVKTLNAKKKELTQTISALRKKLFEEIEAAEILKSKAAAIGAIKLAVFQLKDADARDLRGALDILKKKAKDKAIVVGFIIEEDKVTMNISCTKDVVKKGFSCKEAASKVARSLGGSGGGRDDFAFAGSKGVKGISLDKIKKTVLEVAKDFLG